MALIDGLRFSLVLLVASSMLDFTLSASLSLPSLVPAFVWSNHRLLDKDSRGISYQTLSPEYLAETVKPDFIATESQHGKEIVAPMDFVMAFFGRTLRSRDVSRQSGPRTSDLLQVLNSAVTTSNSSVSLPYVAPAKNGVSLADVLVKSIVGDLDASESRLGEVITVGSCVHKEKFVTKSVRGLKSLKGYLSSRKSIKPEGETDLLIVCSSSDVELLGSISLSEGEVLDELLWSLDSLKARYVALYATDLSAENGSASKSRGRQLGSVIYAEEEFCDEVCQTKAHLLEGLLVGFTLLIILISGLCCMAGITTPSRFEQVKEGH